MVVPVLSSVPLVRVRFIRTASNKSIAEQRLRAVPTVRSLTVNGQHGFIDPLSDELSQIDPDTGVGYMDLLATDDPDVIEAFGWDITFDGSTRPLRRVQVPQSGPNVETVVDPTTGASLPAVWLNQLADFTGASGPVGSDVATMTFVDDAIRQLQETPDPFPQYRLDSEGGGSTLTQRGSAVTTASSSADRTAAANEIVPLDTSGGTFTVTGPTGGGTFGARWKAGTAAPTIAAPSGYTINGTASINMGLAPGGSSGELVVWQAFGTDYQPIGGFKPQSALNEVGHANYTLVGEVPAALGWDNTNYPITPTLIDNLGTGVHTGSIGQSAEAFFTSRSGSTALSAPGAELWVSTAGADTNAGTSSGAPFRTLFKAVEAANAAAVPTRVNVAAGVYERSRSFFFTATPPTVDIAFVATGGRVVTGPFDLITASTRDATYPRCFTATVANCDRVLDTAVANDLGNHRELVQVADAAACNLVPGSWALVSGTLYIHRADEAAITTTNTRVYRNQSFNLYVGAAINVYLGGNGNPHGFDLEGCPGAGVATFAQSSAAQTNPRRLIVLANSSFKYGGGAIGAATCGVSVSAWCGLIAAFNCAADANATDGWNIHDAQGAAWCGLLTVNCQGFDNGRGSATSCNGWTLHEAVKGIDIAGRYRRNRGGTIRNINTSKAWLLGTVVEDDLGDQRQGGLVPPTAIRMDDSAEMWCERVRTVMPAGSLAYVTGSGTAKIHRRGCASPAQVDLAVGTIDSY